MSFKFHKLILNILKQNPNTLILSSDNALREFSVFQALFPKRVINFGISEANMVSYAAGLSSCGKIPFVFGIASFLTMRAFEQIRYDVAIPKSNVKLIGMDAGCSLSGFGNSHYAINDIALIGTLKQIRLFCPASLDELHSLFTEDLTVDSPSYYRLQLMQTPQTLNLDNSVEKSYDVIILSTGVIYQEVRKVIPILAENNVSCKVVPISILNPLDTEVIRNLLYKTKLIVTIEEPGIKYGFNTLIREALYQLNCNQIPLLSIGLPDTLINECLYYEDILKANGIGANEIHHKIMQKLKC